MVEATIEKTEKDFDLRKETEEYLNLILEHGILTLGSRLKRLSELIVKQVQDLYLESGIDFKPTWFPFILALRSNDDMDIQTLAKKLRLTHSAVSQFIKEASANGVVSVKAGTKDLRQKHIRLTEKGKSVLVKITPCLMLLEDVLNTVTDNKPSQLLQALDNIEIELRNTPLIKRNFSSNKIHIVKYSDDLQESFAEINKKWIQRYFSIEAKDARQLDNPRAEIIDKGGMIFLALNHLVLIGSIGIIHKSKEQAEIVKMTVSDNMLGQGIAQSLLQKAIDYCKEQGYKEMVLDVHTSLSRAVHIYEKFGFKRRPDLKSEYARIDLVMTKSL